MVKQVVPVSVVAMYAALVSLLASPALDPATMRRVGRVDERFQSYNVEMVEVTGGRFWAPYRKDAAATEAAPAPPSVTGVDPTAFRMRPPLDLGDPRLRALAAALGPAYVRVSGTWANSTYFHDSDDPAPSAPPTGFGGVLTRAQWRGVVEFARAANAKLVTSFAISDGVRDAQGVWTPAELQKLLAYTSSIGGAIAAAELFNEPNIAARGGAPKGYDAAAYARDFRVFLPFIRKTAPGLLVLGPGSVSEGGMLANFPGGIKSEDMLRATGPGLDAVSYHFYGGVSERCARAAGGIGQRSPDAALSEDWLSRTERDARFYAALRDRFEPGRPLWLTETGESACGGNPWASTFADTFRYAELRQRLRLDRRGDARTAPELLGCDFLAEVDGNDGAGRGNRTSAGRPCLCALPGRPSRRRVAARRQHRPQRGARPHDSARRGTLHACVVQGPAVARRGAQWAGAGTRARCSGPGAPRRFDEGRARHTAGREHHVPGLRQRRQRGLPLNTPFRRQPSGYPPTVVLR